MKSNQQYLWKILIKSTINILNEVQCWVNSKLMQEVSSSYLKMKFYLIKSEKSKGNYNPQDQWETAKPSTIQGSLQKEYLRILSNFQSQNPKQASLS